jgi:hypothetical protein
LLRRRFLLKRLEIKVFYEMGLPEGMTPIKQIHNLFRFSLKTNLNMVNFAIRDNQVVKDLIIGGEKIDHNGLTPHNISKIQTLVVNNMIKAEIRNPDPVGESQYFGTKDLS